MKRLLFAIVLLTTSEASAQNYSVPVAPGGGGYEVHDQSVAGTVANSGTAIVNEIGGMSQTINASIQNLGALITNSQQAILNGQRQSLKIQHSIEMEEKYNINPSTDLSEYAENSNTAIAQMEMDVGAFAQTLSRAAESLETGTKAAADMLYLKASCVDGFRGTSTSYIKDTLAAVCSGTGQLAVFPLADRDITTSDYVGEDRLLLPALLATSSGAIDLTPLLLTSPAKVQSMTQDEKMWIGAFLSCANMIPHEALPQNTSTPSTDDMADAMIYLKHIAAEKTISDRCFRELAKRTMIPPNANNPAITALATAQSGFCTNAGPSGTNYLGADEYAQCKANGISLFEAGSYFACRYRSHSYVLKLRQAGFEPKDIMKQLLDGPKDCIAYWDQGQQEVLGIKPDLATMPARVRYNVTNSPQQSQ